MLCGGAQRRRFQLGTHTLAFCDACRIGQLAPLPSGEELAALYASPAYFSGSDRLGYADYVHDAPQLTRTFRRKLALLLRHGAVEDLLEIGCGPGYFLRAARAAGVPRVVGVDRNPWAVEAARRDGLDVCIGSIDALPPQPRFDAAVMLDVLEHVPEPVPFLRAVRARLRPGGRLLIMTPNLASWLARVSGPRWVSLKVPEHVLYYTPHSIRRVLADAGFAVRTLRPTGQYVTLAFLLDRVARVAPALGRPLAALVRALRRERAVVYVSNGSIDVVAQILPSDV